MLRRSLLPALVAALATLATGTTTGTTSPAAAAPLEVTRPAAEQVAGASVPRAEGDAPLALSISSMAPSLLPAKGRITITGTITNHDDVAWSRVNLYPFISRTPMTTRAELAAAAVTAPDEPVGDRINYLEPADTVDVLEPGQTAAYSVSVRSRDVDRDQPGVYWFGVHALGESPEGRDFVADGRARTFLPLARGSQRPVETALVVPLRRQVRHDADGSITDLEDWTETLGPGGRLHSLLDLGAAAGTRPVTWLVDPALADAAARLAAGNPARSLRPTLPEGDGTDPDQPSEPEGGGSEGPSGSATPPDPDAGTDAPAPAEEKDAEPDAETAAAATTAETFLGELREALTGAPVLVLPYGDLDLSAAAQHDDSTYERARQRTGDVLGGWDLRSEPAAAPPAGYLDAAAIAMTAEDDTLLVSDRMLGDPLLDGDAPTVVTVDGRRLVVSSSGAATGGPGPDARMAPVALRQRILAEAAVRRGEPGRPPLVVTLPDSWSPASAEDFFAGLDADWLQLVGVPDLADELATAVPAEELVYPPRQERRELDAVDFTAAAELTRAGTALQNLLVRNDQVARDVAGQALTSLSYANRASPLLTRAATNRSRSWIEAKLEGVRISAGPVLLSSGSGGGDFSATIENRLDQPGTVRVRALVDDEMTISAPDEAIVMAPNSRRSVLLRAATDRQGVHNVTLVVTDIDGTALGSSDRFSIRATEVSGIIWVIIGTGCALLFGAIALRLVRRVRAARRGPADETSPTPADAAPPGAAAHLARSPVADAASPDRSGARAPA